MKDQLKDHILDAFKTQNKTMEDASSFGMINSASGQWHIRVYWKKKTLEGQKKQIDVQLDHDFETMVLAAQIMLELRSESSKIKMTFKKEEKPKDPGRGYGE